MFSGGGRRNGTVRLLVFALLLCAAFFALGEVLMPEAPGTKVRTDGKLTVDSSHSADGYIMVKAEKDKKRMKLRVTAGDSALNYDINSDGTFEVFPLQYGRENYTVALYRNVEGKKYKEVGQVTVSPKEMEDELRCFLFPNQYVNYREDTECVQAACDLCGDMTDSAEIFRAVCRYVVSNFTYDYVKSMTVKPGTLPDIEYCWKNRKGICQDLSAVTCAMLRSQGVPARLVIGTLSSGRSSTAHAWVLAVVNGKDTFFDPTAELGACSAKDTYTTERWY